MAEAAWVLRWWLNAGVPGAVDETPRNRFVQANAHSAAAASPTTAAQAIPPAVAFAAGPSFAQKRADSGGAASAPDLDALRGMLEAFEGCALKKTATQLVFSDGVPGSRVRFVGEAPGGDEDRIGRPFVGRAGQLLDRMLKAVGLDRTQVYIANVVPWRPPGNRTPTPQETQACLPFVRRQIELAAPQILVCMGASAAQTLLGAREGITRIRGRWFAYPCEDGREIRALAMLHPAYLLRQPGQKRAAWKDMLTLAGELAT